MEAAGRRGSRPVAVCAKVTQTSITSSHSAHAPIVSLDGDGAAPAKPSPLVGVTAISVVTLTISRSPNLNSNAGSLKVHTLSQSWRRGGNTHYANESKCN